MEKYSKEWWTSRYNDHQDEELNEATHRIGNILDVTGSWNYCARVLEVQCGLGVMSHFMKDNGFESFYGTDNDPNVKEFWEFSDILQVAEPDKLPYKDGFFDLVAWFTVPDGRVPKEDWEDVIDEMVRVSQGRIIIKPYAGFDKKSDEDFLGWMLDKHLRCTNMTPVLWYYTFIKE